MVYRTCCLFLFFCFPFIQACDDKQPEAQWPLQNVDSQHSGITFSNHIENDEDFNIFLYRNFYNGGGVAIGDINNDGLSDVYFTANMGRNALYLNKGNFEFEDITDKAGVASENKWSTGVALADVNNDGLLDIYVCNAGYRKGMDQRNDLYINNGDLTFTESAATFGLDENGYTTHAAFFDYDKDGDLDVYILNNSFIPVNTLNYSNKRDVPASQWAVAEFLKGGGDKLLRNDNNRYVDVTHEAGIYNSLIGFGLGITVGDVNDDGWDDIYVSNDFFERDYLYINQKNGTFKEEVKEQMNHLSAFSMGADMGDVNNDGHMDIFVTDMLPSDPFRLKTTTSFEDYHLYQMKLERDFYHQYMHNTLQLNRGDGTFSEIAEFSGVSASDWSWGALMFDIDNDGWKDIYVCNGIFHDVTNQDFIDFFANDAILRTALSGKKVEVNNIISRMPSVPLKNKVFMNNQNLTFKDITESSANTPSFSNGAAYGDLDNDGDLDLIVNNINQPAFVVRNLASENGDSTYISVKLDGPPQNRFAIGSEIFVYANGLQRQHLMPSRGFQSSVDYRVHFGLGKASSVDSVKVRWPDLTETVVTSPEINRTIAISHAQSKKGKFVLNAPSTMAMFEETDFQLRSHQEDNFIDFYNEGLIIEMVSREGPAAALGDVDGDGIDDLFMAGARNQPGIIYLQTKGGFKELAQPELERDSIFEDTACAFADVDDDGDLDLITGSGGNFAHSNAMEMQDRLYLNNGRGVFKLKTDAFPNNGMNTAVILPLDFDSDGDIDLFVGSRSVPNAYGVQPQHYLYENTGEAKFKNVITDKAPEVASLGMITDALMSDINNDGVDELIIVGQWMSPQVFQMKGGKLSLVSSGLENYKGWWSSVMSADVDGDGDNDLVLGNRGENFSFSGSEQNPVRMWVYDFDGNSTVDKVITTSSNGKDYPVHLKKELTQQINSLKRKNLKYSEFATKSIDELIGPDLLKKSVVLEATWFKSSIAYNNKGQFELVALPAEVQFSCINAIFAGDLNGDKKIDLVLAGNKSGFTPQFSKLDASFGTVMIGEGGTKFRIPHPIESGLSVRGEVTQIIPISLANQRHLLFLRNDQKPKVYKIKEQ